MVTLASGATDFPWAVWNQLSFLPEVLQGKIPLPLYFTYGMHYVGEPALFVTAVFLGTFLLQFLGRALFIQKHL
jgi:hypothetical protein